MIYTVVNGKYLKGKVPFWDKNSVRMHGHSSLAEYAHLLQISSEYFRGIRDGSIDISDRKYFIIAPQSFLEIGIAGHIDIIDDLWSHKINAHDLYIDKYNAIHVIKKGRKYYFTGTDGRHRFMAAKKYRLDILVCIDNEPDKRPPPA